MRLKTHLPILVVFVFLGCTSQENAGHTDAAYRSFANGSGQIVAAGFLTGLENIDSVICELEGEEISPWKMNLRTGPWKFWYPNGNLKAQVTFKVFQYDECCFAGYCKQAYELRTGKFRVFHPNGELMADGKFKRSSTPIGTNCVGGARIWIAEIDSDAHFFDEDGASTSSAIIQGDGLNPLEF